MTDLDRRRFLKIAGGLTSLSCLPSLGCHHAPTRPHSIVDFDGLRSSYGLADGVTYFNHASIGTMPLEVLGALQGYLATCEQNPWLYIWGKGWEEKLDRTRSLSADLLGCGEDEVAITHSTTEGFSLLAQGLPLGKGDEVLFSSLNHVGASESFHRQAARRGFSVRKFEFPEKDAPGLTVEDIVDLHRAQFREETRVLVIPHIDNRVGLRHPIDELCRAARDHGIEFIAIDGAQAVGMIPLDVRSWDIDFYACSPHKWVQSSKGTGLLYVRPEALDKVFPMFFTWGQKSWTGTARAFEDYGTRDIPERVALGDAIAYRNLLDPVAMERKYRLLAQHVQERVDADRGLRWHSPREWTNGASLYVVEVEGYDAKEIFETMYHDHGFVFRAFGEPLNAMRLSPDIFNDVEEFDRFFDILRREFPRRA